MEYAAEYLRRMVKEKSLKEPAGAALCPPGMCH